MPCAFVGLGNGLTMPAANAGVLSLRSDLSATVLGLANATTVAVERVIEAMRAHGAPERCIFVAAPASTSPGLQWIAPSMQPFR